MNDRPTATELIDAVRGFLERELLPALGDARLKFQTLVAANVLAVAARELNGEEAMLRRERERLGGAGTAPASLAELRSQVRGLNEDLCRSIHAGDHDAPERQASLRKLLREGVIAKLAVANPKYLATG